MAKKHDCDPIEIDERQLDREWQAQPRLMYQALKRLANAKREEREAKAKLDLIEAELSQSIRRTPERYGVAGTRAPSNDVVASLVITQSAYRDALKDLSDAKYAVDVLEAEVSALSHKKAGLENMVILHCKGYGAECKLPAEHVQAARSAYDQVVGGSPFKDVTRPIDDD